MPIVNSAIMKIVTLLLGASFVIMPIHVADPVDPVAHLYIVVVNEDDEEFQYEFSNLKHARELFNNESNAQLIEYKNGKHHLVEVK